MAQDDRPYGGYIEAQEDGSVVWEIRHRYFPQRRDVDGKIEYAIRIMDGSRKLAASADGKCAIIVNDQARAQSDHLTFLIVSGYDSKAPPADAVVLGKSYFITSDATTGAEGKTAMPRYDVALSFDDYDLEYADLPRSLDATDMEICYIAYQPMWDWLGLSDPGDSSVDSATLQPHDPRHGATVLRPSADKELSNVDKLHRYVSMWRRISKHPNAPILRAPVSGARTLVVEGLSSPETLALMFHGRSGH